MFARLPTPGREIAKIAIPVGLEFVLILGLGFINQIVVGGLGAVAVAAVGFANSVILVPMFTLMALGYSTSILVARAYGAKRAKELNSVVSTSLITTFTLSALLSIPLMLWPTEILRFSGASAEIIDSGSSFLAVCAISLTPGVLSGVFSGILRSANHARSPMVATLITVALNTPIAIVLVFGLGPIPAMGVVGAAWASTLTTITKVVVLWVQTFGIFDVADWVIPRALSEWRELWKPLFTLALPLAATEIFYTMGIFFFNVLVGAISDDALAAMQIISGLESVFVVASLGLMSAITALAGHAVGAGDAGLAVAWINRIKRIGIVTAIIFGVLLGASAFGISGMFPAVGQQVVWMAMVGVLANAAFQPLKVRNVLLGAAILPSGNDVKGVMMGDFTGPFLVSIPLAIALGFFTPLGFYGVIIARLVEEVAKFAVFRWREHKLNWPLLVEKHLAKQIDIDDPHVGLMQA